MEKDDLINYIMVFSANASKAELEKLSVEALAMIKVKIDIEIMHKNYISMN